MISARLPPQNSLILLELNEGEEGYLDLPSFHSGVAAGLRCSNPTISSSWLLFNKPTDPTGNFLLLISFFFFSNSGACWVGVCHGITGTLEADGIVGSIFLLGRQARMHHECAAFGIRHQSLW